MPLLDTALIGEPHDSAECRQHQERDDDQKRQALSFHILFVVTAVEDSDVVGRLVIRWHHATPNLV